MTLATAWGSAWFHGDEVTAPAAGIALRWAWWAENAPGSMDSEPTFVVDSWAVLRHQPSAA